jgi:hypothetical protein
MALKKNQNPEEFWQGYEKQVGEKVLAFSLGQYMSGWAGEGSPLWGLLIATEGGFRFQHFPSENWISAAVRITRGGDGPREVAIFIPKEKFVSVELKEEKSLLKKLFLSKPPRLAIHYISEAGEEAVFIAEGDEKAKAVAEKLKGLIASPITPS